MNLLWLYYGTRTFVLDLMRHSSFYTSFSLCSVVQWCLTLCNPMEPTSLLCPRDSSDQSVGAGCHFLLQGTLPDPGMEIASLTSPALTDGFFTTLPPEKPPYYT